MNLAVVLQMVTGVLALAAAGVLWSKKAWLSAGVMTLSVAVVWISTYYRMSINQWVTGDNTEKLYWFGLLGQVTSWGMVGMGIAMVLVAVTLPRQR